MSTDLADDYLWDRGGPVDDEIAGFERRLAVFASDAGSEPAHALVLGDLPDQRSASDGRMRTIAVAAAAGFVLALGLAALARSVGDTSPHEPDPRPPSVPAVAAPASSAANLGLVVKAPIVVRAGPREVRPPAEVEPDAAGRSAAAAPQDSRAQGSTRSRKAAPNKGPAKPEPASPARAAGSGGEKVDKDHVRSVVRENINRIKHCYNQGLTRRPDLAGRVAVQFVIAPSGKVIDAQVASSDLDDDATEACIVKAVESFEFRRRKGEGNVMVTYPFVLSPG